MNHRYLYRGITLEHHEREQGQLRPIGTHVEGMATYDGTFTYGGGLEHGETKTNGLIMHQKNSSTFPTAYVSFSPDIERARFYATHEWHDGQAVGGHAGLIYVVDTELLATHGMEAQCVAEYALQPTCPEDDEVVLLASDRGPLPQGIVVDRLPA